MMGTLAAVSVYAMMRKATDFRWFGKVAEWFKAAVLKTAIREHRSPADSSQSRRNPNRSNRVHGMFARNIRAQESAQ